MNDMMSFRLPICRLIAAAVALVMGIGICPIAAGQTATTVDINAAGVTPAGKDPTAAHGKAGANKVGPGEKININRASASELARLPGIGESKAEAIVDYRTKNGNFQTLEDIEKVKGIKAGLFAKLKDHIELSD